MANGAAVVMAAVVMVDRDSTDSAEVSSLLFMIFDHVATPIARHENRPHAPPCDARSPPSPPPTPDAKIWAVRTLQDRLARRSCSGLRSVLSFSTFG